MYKSVLEELEMPFVCIGWPGLHLTAPVLASALEPDNGDILGISPPQHGHHHTTVNTINSGSNDSKYQTLPTTKADSIQAWSKMSCLLRSDFTD